MARMSIYVSDELKARMDERETNWSAVAQDAFWLEINSTSTPATGNSDMTAVIERLRASKEKKEQEERPDWVDAGRKWAMNVADYDQLERIARIDPESEDYFHDDALEQSLLAQIAMAILDKPEHDPADRQEIEDISEIVLDGTNPSVNRLSWWLEGAQQIWDEVEHKI